ncbi:MAG TPA: metalloregulator ArsR/SmtB family transcription factor [Gemmatimonadaceae bacterium]
MSLSLSSRIEFGVTPRFDAFYALYTLTSAGSTPLDAWKNVAISRLPRDFAKAASRIAPLPIFWPLLADAAQTATGEISFDELLSTIRETPLEDLQRNILGGIFHDRDAVESLIRGRRTLKQLVTNDSSPGTELITAFGLRPYDANSQATRAINSLLKQPEPFRDELATILETFWNTGFHDDWKALEPPLEDESFRMRDERDEATSAALDSQLSLPVRLDDAAQAIQPKSGTAIRYQQIERCFVIPSAFNTRKWWAKYDTSSGRVILYFPVAFDLDLANRIVRRDMASTARELALRADINAETVFRALGDTTRYAIASILARTPTTSAELARSLNVSKPTITHHVQALRSAGLIKETPSGGSTRLSLSRETVAALSGAAVEQLFSSSAELNLGTTRRKRQG